MKNFLRCFALLTLAGCAETDVTPDTITQVEYSYLVGFTGQTFSLSVTPARETLRTGYNPGKVCQRSISADEWQAIVHDFDWKSFQRENSTKVGECCDHGAASITVTAGRLTHHVEREFIVPDSSSLGKLSARLSTRLTRYNAVCQ